MFRYNLKGLIYTIKETKRGIPSTGYAPQTTLQQLPTLALPRSGSKGIFSAEPAPLNLYAISSIVTLILPDNQGKLLEPFAAISFQHT
jgi:hypothetical protein